jgi:hypothetical protein
MQRRSKRKAQYRGYKIEMERRDLCWFVSVSPTSAELPRLSSNPFHTMTQSERAAMKQARQHVDHALQD